MKTLLLSFLLLISCTPADKTPSEGERLIPEGFFMINNQLMFSDGKRFVCNFESWEQYEELRGRPGRPEGLIYKFKELPSTMKHAGICNINIITNKFYR